MDQTMHSESINEITAAMVKAQASILPAIKNCKNPFHKNVYADLNACWDACRKALENNNLAVYQLSYTEDDGKIFLMTMLAHSSGQWIKSYMPLLLKNPDSQGLGSALTYVKRYSLCALLGICADEDDDGNSASPMSTNKAPAVPPVPVKISKQDADLLIKKLDLVDAELKEGIKNHLKKEGILDVKDMPASILPSIMKALDDNIAKKNV